MNIGIGLKKTAYTPEAYAYEKYLTSKGFKVQLEQEEKLDLNNDINIYKKNTYTHRHTHTHLFGSGRSLDLY